MQRVVSISSIVNLTVNPSRWTAIIPAAGKGSRLGYNLPKILYPILGRPIIDWLVDLLRPVCSKFVFVFSPEGRNEIEPILYDRLGDAFSILIQEKPTGMGDAVLLTQNVVKTPNSLVVWGDQVALRHRTVIACAASHEQNENAILTMPSVIKKNAYINFMRDEDGRIVSIAQGRENEIQGEFGENDCGLFLFTTDKLFKILHAAKRNGIGIGQSTGEFNLVQALPCFETGEGSVLTIRIDDPMEALGVNTLNDADLISGALRQRLEETLNYNGK